MSNIRYFMIIGCVALICGSAWAQDKTVLMMATTTSTDDTGLLDYLAPHFQRATGIELRWTATGTGKALALGRNCDADVLLVHAPDTEIQFVNEGYGLNRRPVMFNAYVIIGPPADPAGIKGRHIPEAMKAIATSKALFISRGDRSGTHHKELDLWKVSGIPQPEKEPWYVQTGQGMLSTINVAAEKAGYTLTDRGTFIKYTSSRVDRAPLAVLAQGDVHLRNQYSVIEISPQRCGSVEAEAARRFSEWMAGSRGQSLIGDFRLMGKQLFFPNASTRQ